MKPLDPIQISELKHLTPTDVTLPTSVSTVHTPTVHVDETTEDEPSAQIATLDISAGAATSKDVPENSNPTGKILAQVNYIN